MAIDVDKSAATRLLNSSFNACSQTPILSCLIKETIDFVMNGKNCLTYRYIMFTALVAKAVNPAIDIMSLQAGDRSEGAYDARSLAKDVVFRFQKTLLGNILDGSNSDPLVNKPARFERLRIDNPVAGGDPTKALRLLCADLPKIDTSMKAKQCVDYIVSLLLKEKQERDRQRSVVYDLRGDISLSIIYKFLDSLLNQSFGGASLVIVTTALYHVRFPDEEFRIIPHPVNQSGSSSRQFSDLDLVRDNRPFMGTELKDRPFTSADVDHAAETAYRAGAKSLLFVAGRQSTFAAQPPTYFTQAREKYGEKGMFEGVTSIDSLIDIVFASHSDINPMHILDIMCRTAERIGAIEAQMWLYEHILDIQQMITGNNTLSSNINVAEQASDFEHL